VEKNLFVAPVYNALLAEFLVRWWIRGFCCEPNQKH